MYKIKLHFSDTNFDINRDLWLINIDGTDIKLTKHDNNAPMFNKEEIIKHIEEIENVYITDQKAKRLCLDQKGKSFKIYVFNANDMSWQTHLEFQGIDEKSYTFENYELGKYWNKNG